MPQSLRFVCQTTRDATTATRAALLSTLSEAEIQRIRAVKASRRGGRRSALPRRSLTEERLREHVAARGSYIRDFRGGWRLPQPLTGDQVKERMAPRFSHNSTEATGAPSHQGDAKTRAAAEEFNRGEMEKHCGRFSRDQSFMDEQMKAFAAAREEKYRGTGQGSPFVEKFASMYPAPTKERIKQREAAHEAFHASRVMVPSDGKTPGQAQAASNAAPSFPGRGWFTHSARHGGHRGRYRHAHYQD